MVLLDDVRGELRKQNVKLWLPPYTQPLDEPSAVQKLSELASGYAAQFGAELSQVEGALEELRQHALRKLKEKEEQQQQTHQKTSRVTLLGRVRGVVAATAETGGDLSMNFEDSDMGMDVRRRLCERLGASQLKVIAGGRALQDDLSLNEQGWLCDERRNGQPLKVLIFAAGRPRQPPASDLAFSAASGDPPTLPGASTTSEIGLGPGDEGGSAALETPPAQKLQACSVGQIREAAEQLTVKGFGDFELSDATTGRLIPVQPAVRQALVTAIALHARGREHLASRDDGAAAEALEFLVEADRCFERCRERGAWQLLEQLQNFGELQLDICWAYALLGDTERLPDAEVRLGAAERMISRQVDKNFLTLAEVKAEQGQTLPPEVLPSVRLWLLRGIAHSCRGNIICARTDLKRAALFLESLKVDEETVGILLTMGASRAQAVAALRRCGGSPDRAAEDFMAAARHRKVARSERDAQRKLGQTVDGSFVDPDLVAQLKGMGIEKEAAVAALKKTNNDIDKALDVIQTQQQQQEAVSPQQQLPVDELALASVLSLLGSDFPEHKAEAALRASGGDVEGAMLMLTAGESADSAAQIEGNTAPGTTPTPSASRIEAVAATVPDAESPGAATEVGLKAVWQFEQAADEWQNYPAEAAGIVEAAYQRWCSRSDADPVPASSSVVDVQSGNWKYSVDLGAMMQVNIQNPNRTSRRVRRRLENPQDAAANEARAELEEQARQVVERELGRCLRRDDLEDDIAGASLVVEAFLVQKHLSNL